LLIRALQRRRLDQHPRGSDGPIPRYLRSTGEKTWDVSVILPFSAKKLMICFSYVWGDTWEKAKTQCER